MIKENTEHLEPLTVAYNPACNLIKPRHGSKFMNTTLVVQLGAVCASGVAAAAWLAHFLDG